MRLDKWRAESATPESQEEFTARHSATPRKAEEPWFKRGQLSAHAAKVLDVIKRRAFAR
jgi:hypothetical protein